MTRALRSAPGKDPALATLDTPSDARAAERVRPVVRPRARLAAVATWPRGVVAAVGVYTVFGGLLTLIGWGTDVVRLTDWRNDGISMFPNAAACAILSGLTLLLNGSSRPRWRAIARAIPIIVAVVGGLTLVEHVTGIDLGIDTLLFDRPWGQSAAAAPMRIGPPASISYLIIGTALLLANFGPRARGASAAMGVVVTAIAMLSLIGYLYGAHQMFTIPRLTGIAMQTASMILALGIGLVASVPDREPMRTILEPSAAGMLARRALPVVVVLALALGWVRVSIQGEGLVDTEFGTALRTLVEIVLLTGLLWWAVAMVRAHEHALRDSEAEVHRQASQLTTFVETAAIGLHWVGPDGVILWANDAELKILGYARDEYVGHHIGEFHADRDVIADVLARLHRGEKLLEYPARMRCKDGSIKLVLIDSSVLWDEGRFVHTHCFTRDVTERKKAEETQALLAAIIEASDDAIISKTLDGTISSWNAGAERMFGYAAPEAVGKPIGIIIPPERLDEDREILERLRRGARSEHHYETVGRAKDGRILDISLTISPVNDASGRIIGASKIARDVTERKRAGGGARGKQPPQGRVHRDARPRAAQPARADPQRRALPQAHGIDGCRSPDSAVEMIERQVAQMSRLIDDLLDVSRISRGMLELRRDRVACADIVEAAVDACRDELEAKGQTLRRVMPGRPRRARRRPRAARAGALQPDRQRRQVHAAGRRDRPDGRRRGERDARDRRQGQRRRHPGREAHRDLRALRAASTIRSSAREVSASG